MPTANPRPARWRPKGKHCCGHPRYNFILIDTTRHCSCATCPHQWQIQLGGVDHYGYAETDRVQNDMTGAAFAAMHVGALRWS